MTIKSGKLLRLKIGLVGFDDGEFIGFMITSSMMFMQMILERESEMDLCLK